MAQNMQKRKDELFINVQQGGQLSLTDIDPTVASTVENELMTVDEIKAKLKEHLSRFPGDVGITKLLATFVNDYGLLCEFKMIHTMLEELSNCGMIGIERSPAVTIAGKPSTFWEESKDRKIVIRRRKS